MKKKFKISGYIAVYMLFVFLYTLTTGNLSTTNLQSSLYASIFPSLVGGTITNLL